MKSIVLLSLLVVCFAGMELQWLNISPERIETIFKNVARRAERPKGNKGDIITGFKEFCEGFYQGINETLYWDLWMFGECGAAFNRTGNDFVVFWKEIQEVFKHFSFEGLYKACVKLFDHIVKNFASCTVGIGYVIRILDLFRHMSWEDIGNRFLFTFLTNAFGLFEDIVVLITCTVSLNPGCMGDALGQIVYIMLFH